MLSSYRRRLILSRLSFRKTQVALRNTILLPLVVVTVAHLNVTSVPGPWTVYRSISQGACVAC